MKNLNEIDSYLYENPAIVQRFSTDNQDLFKAFKDRFKLYLDGENVVAVYLLGKALSDLIVGEMRANKIVLKGLALKELGIILMDTDNTKHGVN